MPKTNTGCKVAERLKALGDSGELSGDQQARSRRETEPSSSVLVPGRSRHVADAWAASHKAAKPHPRYQQIYAALRRIEEARPRGQAEVFALLDRDKVPVPPARPFDEGSRWMQGFRKNPKRARIWLSKSWSRL